MRVTVVLKGKGQHDFPAAIDLRTGNGIYQVTWVEEKKLRTRSWPIGDVEYCDTEEDGNWSAL